MTRLPLLIGLVLGTAIVLPLDVSRAAEITGKGLYKYCKACHGSRGEGGQEGKYPRIAGMPQSYIEQQLRNFKALERVNKPMIPIFKDQRLDAPLIEMVAAYIARMSEPSLNLWPYKPAADALSQFASRAEFNAQGEAIFRQDCAQCHGEDARGKPDKETPPLVNQYPVYLEKQIGDFIAGRRENEHCNKRFDELNPAKREAIFNYLVELGK